MTKKDIKIMFPSNNKLTNILTSPVNALSYGMVKAAKKLGKKKKKALKVGRTAKSIKRGSRLKK